MKTIYVAYVKDRSESLDESKERKTYSFNTEEVVEVGQMLDTNNYNSFLVVLYVFEEHFPFFNFKTGKLKLQKEGDTDVAIRVFDIVEELPEKDKTDPIVHCKRIDREEPSLSTSSPIQEV